MAVVSLKNLIRNEAYQIVFLQLASIVALSCLIGLIADVNSGISALAGGMAYGLPNLLFVWAVFRFAGAQQMTRFLSAFFVGEMMKLILAAFLFLIIVKYLSDSLLSVLVGFIGAIVSFWFVSMWHFLKPNMPRKKIMHS